MNLEDLSVLVNEKPQSIPSVLQIYIIHMYLANVEIKKRGPKPPSSFNRRDQSSNKIPLGRDLLCDPTVTSIVLDV
jgi:hypothetical protein